MSGQFSTNYENDKNLLISEVLWDRYKLFPDDLKKIMTDHLYYPLALEYLTGQKRITVVESASFETLCRDKFLSFRDIDGYWQNAASVSGGFGTIETMRRETVIILLYLLQLWIYLKDKDEQNIDVSVFHHLRVNFKGNFFDASTINENLNYFKDNAIRKEIRAITDFRTSIRTGVAAVGGPLFVVESRSIEQKLSYSMLANPSYETTIAANIIASPLGIVCGENNLHVGPFAMTYEAMLVKPSCFQIFTEFDNCNNEILDVVADLNVNKIATYKLAFLNKYYNNKSAKKCEYEIGKASIRDEVGYSRYFNKCERRCELHDALNCFCYKADYFDYCYISTLLSCLGNQRYYCVFHQLALHRYPSICNFLESFTGYSEATILHLLFLFLPPDVLPVLFRKKRDGEIFQFCYHYIANIRRRMRNKFAKFFPSLRLIHNSACGFGNGYRRVITGNKYSNVKGVCHFFSYFDPEFTDIREVMDQLLVTSLAGADFTEVLFLGSPVYYPCCGSDYEITDGIFTLDKRIVFDRAKVSFVD